MHTLIEEEKTLPSEGLKSFLFLPVSVHLLIIVIVCLNSRVYMKMTARRIKVHEIPYRIERQIGHGLHSLVYGGHDLRTNQPVAIKVINFMHGSSAAKADTIARRQSYAKEIKLLLYLQPLNPYIIRVFNHDHNDRYGVIVMERGQTFRDFLTSYTLRKKPIPPGMVRHFWYQMVQGIAFLHRIHIVHGDCKPENFIQVGPDRKNLRLIDMGISFHLSDKLTSRLKTITGTPGKLFSDQFLRQYSFCRIRLYLAGNDQYSH